MLDYYVLDMCLKSVAGPGARSQCLLKVGVLPPMYLHPAGCGKCVSIDSKHTYPLTASTRLLLTWHARHIIAGKCGRYCPRDITL